MTETEINLPEKLQDISHTVQEYKDAVIAHFKDMEVDIKDWNFTVGKKENEYTVEVALKLGIKPKAKPE
jgi:hypothetical protein